MLTASVGAGCSKGDLTRRVLKYVLKSVVGTWFRAPVPPNFAFYRFVVYFLWAVTITLPYKLLVFGPCCCECFVGVKGPGFIP